MRVPSIESHFEDSRRRLRPKRNVSPIAPALAHALALFSGLAVAGGVQSLDPVTVTGARAGLGVADSASEGTVMQQQIATRPWLRPGEVLETVPGLIITQHSGDGKANQYFLRGFNLDHGTDFATFVLGMPINMPTHAHGQGYTDLNFLIPELVGSVRYRKGPYSAQQGDFAAAGSARIDYVRTLSSSIGEVGFGENGFRRLFAATAPKIGDGSFLLAAEGYDNDGPWQVCQGYKKKNAVLRYSQGTVADGFDMSFLAYDAEWTATDQIARRAVSAGTLDRFGTLDPTTGGETSRYSLSAQWARRGDASATRASVYAIRYRLNLFSNFTYFASDPANGDQFEQADRRTVFGGEARQTRKFDAFGRDMDISVGGVLRQDDIENVGLFPTRVRQRLATIRSDEVKQTGAGAYAELGVPWSDTFRTIAGVRADTYRAKVTSDTAANSGTSSDSIVTPKFTAVIGPFARSELYASVGHGFHSNDARGTTATVNPDPRDPGFGTALDKAPPLVRAKGQELGARTAFVPGLQTSLTLWQLKLASELVFVGDAGTTEASRPSRRRGVEFANYWTPAPGMTVDLDLAWSTARFRDFDPAGDRIAGAIERTASFGVAYDDNGAYFGGLRARYFGPRPLIEDNSVRSAPSTLVNARLGYRFGKRAEVALDVLNLLDRKVDDIEYFYESQLATEAAPVADRHFHPAEPRTVRVTLRVNF